MTAHANPHQSAHAIRHPADEQVKLCPAAFALAGVPAHKFEPVSIGFRSGGRGTVFAAVKEGTVGLDYHGDDLPDEDMADLFALALGFVREARGLGVVRDIRLETWIEPGANL